MVFSMTSLVSIAPLLNALCASAVRPWLSSSAPILWYLSLDSRRESFMLYSKQLINLSKAFSHLLRGISYNHNQFIFQYFNHTFLAGNGRPSNTKMTWQFCANRNFTYLLTYPTYLSKLINTLILLKVQTIAFLLPLLTSQHNQKLHDAKDNWHPPAKSFL